MSRVGIFAGTFDPVHNGHVAFACQALAEANLDKVILIPEPEPRHKQNVTHIKHRIAMLELAVWDRVGLEVHELTEPQFTLAGSLPELAARFNGDKLVFIFGSDIAAHLPSWPGAEDFIRNYDIVVGVRQSGEAQDFLKYKTIITPFLYLSSSQIRRGESAELPPAVKNYIASQGLYRL